MTRPKPLLMLAYVCVEGPVARRELSDVFFRDADDARDSLSTALGHLRRAGAVQRLPDDRIAALVACDAIQLLRDFDAYRYAAVLHAYGGPFLDGVDVPLGLDLETWLFATREVVARRVRLSAVQRARAQMAAGQWDEARRLAALAVHLRGAPEFEMDELATALPVFERLGLPEADQVRELAESYGLHLERAAAGGAERARIAAVPRRNTAFVGRQDETLALEALLGDPDTRLLTVFGLGGVGKTRLALRLAERAAAHGSETYPDGVAVVSLESVARPAEVAATIAAGLALPATAGTSASDLAAALASSRALLVLDNFERVAGAAPDVALLIDRCPRLQFLVTSRVRLGIACERTFELGGLTTRPVDDRAGAVHDPTVAGSSDAAQLFTERAVGVGFPPEACARDADAIEALCAALEGYPLGIELAAALTRALSVHDIHAALRRDLEVLDHGPLDAPARHRGIRAVLEPSWSMLRPRERDALARLSVFRTDFTFDAAAAVAGLSLPSLLRLVDHAMVRSDGSGRGRFGLHPVVLAFLRERCGEAERAAAEEAHRTFFAERLAVDGPRAATEPREVLERLAAELPDVVHAVRGWFAVADDARAVGMMRALVVDTDFLLARGGGTELIALARQAARAAEALGDLRAAEPLWTKVANAVRLFQDDLDEAAALYARALALAERSGEVGRQVMLHAILGGLLDAQAPDRADAHMTTAWALADAADDDLLRCEVLHRQGYVAALRRDWPRARELNVAAVEIADRLWEAGTRAGRVPNLLFFSLHNLGGAEQELAGVAASIPHHRRALEVALDRGQSLWVAYARHDLALAFREIDDRDAARRHAEEALRLYELQGDLRNRTAVRQLLSTWDAEAAASR